MSLQAPILELSLHGREVEFHTNLSKESAIGILEKLKFEILKQPENMTVPDLKIPGLNPRKF